MENKFERILQVVLVILLVTGLVIMSYFVWTLMTGNATKTSSDNSNMEVTSDVDTTDSNENLNENATSTGAVMSGAVMVAPSYITANSTAACGDLTGAERNVCIDYYATLQGFEAKALELKKSFYYNMKQVEVTFDDGSTKLFTVELADTDEKRVQGLSYRTKIEEEAGMLFSFEGNPASGFHMKDMLFALDILYIDANGKVTEGYYGLPSCVPSQGSCPIEENTTGEALKVLEILPQGKRAVSVVEL